MISILSIDGGGIRGIIPATFLAEIEKRTGKPVCELFDLIAGTSTGGILSTALTAQDARGKPKYTAETVLKAYIEHGGTVFHRSLLRKLVSLGGLVKPKYSARNLDRLLREFLGDARLHSTLTEILVTAYDMASSTPWFFKTSFAAHNRSPVDDPMLSEVALATAAAPTYFPPLTLGEHCLIDGGVFAANPALCAYAEARNKYPEEEDILFLSLGTGLQVHNRPCSKIDNWGVLGWAVPITGVMLNSSSATVNYQMRALVGDKNYVRFQVRLDDDAPGMDDGSEKNIRYLGELARQAVAKESPALDRLCRTLKKRSNSAPAK